MAATPAGTARAEDPADELASEEADRKAKATAQRRTNGRLSRTEIKEIPRGTSGCRLIVGEGEDRSLDARSRS